jgi:hypothetical protein
MSRLEGGTAAIWQEGLLMFDQDEQSDKKTAWIESLSILKPGEARTAFEKRLHYHNPVVNEMFKSVIQSKWMKVELEKVDGEIWFEKLLSNTPGSNERTRWICQSVSIELRKAMMAKTYRKEICGNEPTMFSLLAYTRLTAQFGTPSFEELLGGEISEEDVWLWEVESPWPKSKAVINPKISFGQRIFDEWDGAESEWKTKGQQEKKVFLWGGLKEARVCTIQSQALITEKVLKTLDWFEEEGLAETALSVVRLFLERAECMRMEIEELRGLEHHAERNVLKLGMVQIETCSDKKRKAAL